MEFTYFLKLLKTQGIVEQCLGCDISEILHFESSQTAPEQFKQKTNNGEFERSVLVLGLFLQFWIVIGIRNCE